MSVSMVDVTGKRPVYREAVAEGRIRLRESTARLIREGRVEKGDVFTVSKVAAIQAAKRTSELLPLCHPIPITHVDVDLRLEGCEVVARAIVRTTAQTGVEMEALTAVAVALLNVWDMVKKYEKDGEGQYPTTLIHGVRIVKKTKGS